MGIFPNNWLQPPGRTKLWLLIILCGTAAVLFLFPSLAPTVYKKEEPPMLRMVPLKPDTLIVQPDGRAFRPSEDFASPAANSRGRKAQPGETIWMFPVGNSIFASPALGADGTIYVCANDQKLYALQPTGLKKWVVPRISGEASPAIGTDGTIYVAAFNGIQAITPDGKTKWTFQPQPTEQKHTFTSRSTPATGRDGTIYALIGEAFEAKGTGQWQSREGLYAISPQGTQRWDFHHPTYTEHDSPSRTSPVVGRDGTIYLGSGIGIGVLYAFAPDGAEKWRFTAGGPIRCTPAIGHDGRIYFTTHGTIDTFRAGGKPLAGELERADRARVLYSLNPDGSEAWKFKMFRGGDSSPVIGADGTIYVGSEDENLYAVNYDGSLKWKYEARGPIAASPALCADGTILVVGNSYDNRLHAIRPDGTKKWTLIAGDGIISAPVVAPDGTIYFGCRDTRLYAVKGDSPPAKTPWPALAGNARHSGLSPENAATLASIRPAELKTNPPAPTLPSKVVAVPEKLGAPPAKLWEFVSREKECIMSRPAVGSDGTVYCTGSDLDRNIYAITADGALKWEYSRTNGLNDASLKFYPSDAPVVTDAGRLYVASATLFALDADEGTIRWQAQNDEAPRYVSMDRIVHRYVGVAHDAKPIRQIHVGRDGAVYMVGHLKLAATAADGTPKWDFMSHDRINGIAVATNGTVYLGSDDDRLYAIGRDGREQWHFEAGHRVGPPATGPDGTVYVLSTDKHLYAIRTNGAVKWSVAAGNFNSSALVSAWINTPMVGPDGTIYLDERGKLRAFLPDGTIKWEFLKVPFGGDYAIAPDGTIYAGSGGELFALDSNGVKQWSITIVTNPNFAPALKPALAADGTLHVAMGNGVIAFATGARRVASAKP